MIRTKIKVMSDHPDRQYWTMDSQYIEFTENEGNSKFYTVYPWDVENEHRDILKNAFIIEPRTLSLADKQIEYIYNNYKLFDNIFTHDDELLTLPNAKLYYWGGLWGSDASQPKTKNLSIISSDKQMCDLHRKRIEIARWVRDSHIGDAYGTFDGGKNIDTITAHSQYKFAIVVENSIENYWWTEKINNCFANKTVPIYIGARKIGEIFNADGIIQVNNIEEIKQLLDGFDFDAEYSKRIPAIEENYAKSFRYSNVWDTLFYSYAPYFINNSQVK